MLKKWPRPGSVSKSIDWSMTESLSVHKIWFKSVNNFLRYPGNTDKQTSQYICVTSLAEVIMQMMLKHF